MPCGLRKNHAVIILVRTVEDYIESQIKTLVSEILK
jgi:hypothetical protein